MPTTWIISANAGRARFFAESDPSQPLEEVQDMINDAARMRDSDLETDRLGPTAAGSSSHNIGGTQGVGYAHNGQVGAPNKQYQPAQTPEQHEAEKFARDIAKYLLDAQRDGRYQHLVISASPHFLGELRTLLDPHVKSLIKQEINKDYTHSNGQELREQLRAQMHKQD